MKLITRKSDNVIVTSCSTGTVNIEMNAILLDGNSYLAPAPDYIIYEVADTFVFEIEKQCYDGSQLTDNANYVEPPLTIDAQLRQVRENQKTADQKYKELDLTTASLADVQNAKIAQLDEACNQTITNGFDYTVNAISYRFSCSLAAQQNFTGAKIRMDAGKDTTKAWTALNNSTGKIERVTLSVDDINNITDIIDNLVSTNISKFRDTLEPEVWAATTNAQVDGINW